MSRPYYSRYDAPRLAAAQERRGVELAEIHGLSALLRADDEALRQFVSGRGDDLPGLFRLEQELPREMALRAVVEVENREDRRFPHHMIVSQMQIHN